MKIEGDLFDALQDGVMLIALLEVVSGKKCQEKYHAIAESEIHCRNNLTVAIKFATELIGNMNAEPAGVHDCLPPTPPPHPNNYHPLLPTSYQTLLTHLSHTHMTDFTEKNKKIILGNIWRIILTFQVERDESENATKSSNAMQSESFLSSLLSHSCHLLV